MTTPPEITGKSWAMVAILGLVWGSTFLFIAKALQGIGPFWLAAGRLGFATALMLVIWRFRGFRLWTDPAQRHGHLPLAITGLVSAALPFMLVSWGQQHVTSAFTGVAMTAIALIILPLAHVFVPGERMTWRRTAGFCTGFAGVALLIGPGAFASTGAGLETAGRLAILGATVCYATSSILTRRLPPMDPIGLATVQMGLGAAVVIPVALWTEGLPALPDRDTLILVAILGLIPTAAANLLRVLVVRSAGPVFMSLTNYQVPVWSVLFGALVLHEPLPPSLIWALLLILSGVGLSQYGALRRLFGKA